MWHRRAALLPLLLCACRSSAVDARADRQLEEAHARTARNIVYATCGRDAPEGACGLIMKRVTTEEFRTMFRDKRCAGKSDEACQTLYQRAIDAWMQQRYFAANWRAVALDCDAHPGNCEDPVDYERRLLDSHNTEIRRADASEEHAIEVRRREAQARHARETAATVTQAVGIVDYVTSKGPKCRSYPSLGGGVQLTVCDP